MGAKDLKRLIKLFDNSIEIEVSCQLLHISTIRKEIHFNYRDISISTCLDKEGYAIAKYQEENCVLNSWFRAVQT
jgi:hypothetical protein